MVDLTTEVLKPELARLSNEIKVATIGKVTTFARGVGRAVVSFLQTYVTSDGVEHQPPPTPQAVVYQPAGDGYALAFDLASGDHGVVIAGDSGWDQSWKGAGLSRPQSGQRHTYGSSAFLPGGRLSNDAPVNPVGAMRLGAADGTATIDMTRARAVPLSAGTVDVSAASEATVTGPVSVTLATSAPLGIKLGSAAAVIPVAKAPSVAAASAAGWSAFITFVQLNGALPPDELMIGAAGAAASAEVTAAPAIASTVAAVSD